jgi:NurA-like 5'-3' nuclease
MSTDIINPENRNTTVSTPTNRIGNLRAILRNRCCSFCRQPGHTVNICNDVRISNFELDCVNRRLLFETTEEPIYRFNQWLSEKYLESQEYNFINNLRVK